MMVNDVEIVWLKHAGFKITGAGMTIYIDPYGVRAGEPADLILITHDHFDHCDLPSLRALAGKDTVILAPASAVAKAGATGARTQTIAAGQVHKVGNIEVQVVPAYNVNKTYHPRGAGGVGYVLRIGDVTIYHAGDTDHIPEMSDLSDVDVALLPVSGTYVMDAEEAAGAVKAFKPRKVIPMHYGEIVGSERDAKQFKELVSEEVEVEILSPTV